MYVLEGFTELAIVSGAFLEIEAGGCSKVQKKKWSRARFYAPAFIAAYLSYIQLLPHAALQQKSTAHCPRKERLLLFSSRASLFHSSSVTMLLDKASSYNNFSVYLLVNDNIMYNVVVCSPE